MVLHVICQSGCSVMKSYLPECNYSEVASDRNGRLRRHCGQRCIAACVVVEGSMRECMQRCIDKPIVVESACWSAICAASTRSWWYAMSSMRRDWGNIEGGMGVTEEIFHQYKRGGELPCSMFQVSSVFTLP